MKLDLIARKEWGAKPPLRKPIKMSGYTGIVIHHTGVFEHEHGSGATWVRSIQEHHQTSRRDGGPKGGPWSDVGYHYLVGATGKVFEGRARMADGSLPVGSHALGHNRYWIGVALLGDLREGSEVPLGQLTSTAKLCRWLALRHWMEPCRIVGHRDLRPSKCPGSLDVELVRALAGPWAVTKIEVTA